MGKAIVLAVLSFISACFCFERVYAQNVPCPFDSNNSEGLGVIKAVFKEVQYARPGDGQDKWSDVDQGMIVCSYDIIRTGQRGRARVEFFDINMDENSGPSVINIGSDTQLEIGFFAKRYEVQNEGVLEVLRGAIRTFMKAIRGKNTAFHVRTGTSVCGSRGTTYYVSVAPDSSTTTVVEEGVVACRRPAMPGEQLVEAGEGIEIGLDGLRDVFPVSAEELAALAESVDAFDGWTPQAETPPDAEKLTGYPLPGAEDLPAGCEAPVIAGKELPQAKYRYCDPDASAAYSGCATTRCLTETERMAFNAKKPGFTFEIVPSTCGPGCDAEAGFQRLDFLGHGGFCGKCPDGLRFHRGRGCCR